MSSAPPLVHDDGVARRFAIAALAWCALGLAAGLVLAAQLLFWQASVGPALTFARLRPLHVEIALLGFAGNLAFAMAPGLKGRRKRLALAEETLAGVGLAGLGARDPDTLSGGQKSRVALARVLVSSPRLLLLDEPFSSLDVDLRERLAQELRAILKQTGTTALFVTHDQLEAFALGDAIGVMHSGRLDQWADAYHLYHRPATRFVADFIGHGVFAPATLKRSGNQVVVHTALGALTDGAECPLPSAFSYGQCEVLLRANDIVHDDDAPVKAEIVRKAFRGSEFLYTLRLATGE